MPQTFVEKSLVPVQFGGGINQKVDPKQLQAGQLLALQNGQFSKQGQINKRFGYDILNNTIEGGGSITTGVELANYKNELILFDGTNLYTYLPATGNWSNRGTAISITTEDKDIIRTSQAQQLNPDMAYLNGIEVFAWEDSRGGVRYSTLDSATKAFALSDASLNTSGQQPKCVAFQNQVFIFYSDGKNTLYYQLVNPLNPTVVQPKVAIATDCYAGLNGFPFDAAVVGGKLFVSYLSNSTATGAIQVFYIDGSFNKSPATIVIENLNHRAINSGFHGAINVTGDSGNNVWVSWANGVDIRCSCLSNLLQTILASSFVDLGNAVVLAGIEGPTAQTLLLNYEISSPTAYNEQVKYLTVTNAGVVTAATVIRSVGLASKPWKFQNNIYINTAYQSTLQATDFTFLIAKGSTILTSPVIVAKETPSVGGGLQTNGMCPELVTLSTGVYKFANLQAGKLLSEANTLFSVLGVNSTKLFLTPSNNFINTTQANTLMIVGGILQGYDGISTTELGFHLYPENITATPAGSDGHLSTGTYQYQVEFEWTDNNGQIYRSAPSVALSVSVSANNHVTLSGPTLRLTAKTKISIVIYRTQANGTTFNRVTSTLAPTLNDPTVDSWSFVDVLSDASAAANELIYTTGNVLNNIAPPANSIIATYNNRVFLAGLSDKLLMWYSQTVVDNSNANTIPPQFCQELTSACDPRGDDITALGLLNQSLIIFKKSHIFALTGNGPDATGNNNDFGDPTLITSDVGCINANSVAIVPMGLMFQSSKGIYLLDQSLNTSYIGAPVEDLVNSLMITSTIDNPQDNQVIFTSSNGTALVYDYYFHQWSSWTNHIAADGAIYKNLFTFLTPTGQVYVQNRNKFTDGSVPIYLSFTLPNLSFAGLQGYQRVFKAFILGSYKGAHTLVVNVAYDYSDTFTQSAIVKPAGVNTWGSAPYWGYDPVWGGTYNLYEFRIDFSTQKCTSVRLQISDSQQSAYNEGYSISSIVFEVGAITGGNRLPNSNIYGAK